MRYFGFFQGQKGQALIEYTVLIALITLTVIVAVSTVADEILDIWNDLAEDLDTIDDYVADTDVEDFMPESNEDGNDED